MSSNRRMLPSVIGSPFQRTLTAMKVIQAGGGPAMLGAALVHSMAGDTAAFSNATVLLYGEEIQEAMNKIIIVPPHVRVASATLIQQVISCMCFYVFLSMSYKLCMDLFKSSLVKSI